MNTLKDKAAIVGIGQTEYSRKSGRSVPELALEAIVKAIDDAGLRTSDIDGIVRYGVSQTQCGDIWLAGNLGAKLRFWDKVEMGGGAACATVGHAAAAVSTGLANYVVCFRALNGVSGSRPGTEQTYTLWRGEDPGHDDFQVPYGLTGAAFNFALMARRYMYQYGASSEQLGWVAVTCRQNANRNPRAQMYGRPLTIEDHQKSRMISDPLHLYDCCLQTDGACAVVVTTAERARDLKQKPVYIMSAAQGMLPGDQGSVYSCLMREDITANAGKTLADTIYPMAGLTPKDIDVAQFYDCYTIVVLLQLEAHGFCKRGEAGMFVEGGKRIGIGGELPINTGGGNLSEGYIHGLNHVLEGVRQMRGVSTSQVEGAEICLVTGGSGGPPSSALILRR